MHTVNDLFVLAQTIYGEARGEGPSGMYAVGCVIFNRWTKRKQVKTLAEICKQPYQFSCWNADDPNRDLLLNQNRKLDPAFINSLQEAIFVLREGKHADITKGATHYHSQHIMPYWAKGKEPCAKIGNHWFYNSID